jgi:hypothetical protein
MCDMIDGVPSAWYATGVADAATPVQVHGRDRRLAMRG